MAKIGYARVSTEGQDLAGQIARLEADGCEKVFADIASGKLASRPEWDKLLGYARPGDLIVAVKLDRIGRSTKNLIELATTFKERDLGLRCLDQPIDTSTAMGQMFYTILAAFAQFERDLISERTRDGLEVARARGKKGGRTAKLDPQTAAKVVDLYDRKQMTVQQIADFAKVDRKTVYRTIERQRAAG